MLVPRLKVIALVLMYYFQPEGATGNPWLQFGQLAAITFIAWLVIKRGNKAGDQEVSFWTTYMNQEFSAVKEALKRIEDKLENQRSFSAGAGGHR
jgi:hypothetical protein